MGGFSAQQRLTSPLTANLRLFNQQLHPLDQHLHLRIRPVCNPPGKMPRQSLAELSHHGVAFRRENKQCGPSIVRVGTALEKAGRLKTIGIAARP